MYPKCTSSTVVREGGKGLSGKKTLTARTATNGAVYQTRIETDRQTDRQSYSRVRVKSYHYSWKFIL